MKLFDFGIMSDSCLDNPFLFQDRQTLFNALDILLPFCIGLCITDYKSSGHIPKEYLEYCFHIAHEHLLKGPFFGSHCCVLLILPHFINKNLINFIHAFDSSSVLRPGLQFFIGILFNPWCYVFLSYGCKLLFYRRINVFKYCSVKTWYC